MNPDPLPIVSNPHYGRLGGRPVIERLVDAFYDAMDRRPEAATIRAMHAADLGETRRVLVTYLSEWLGGPRDYTAERGPPQLRRRHQRFGIDAAARDAWMACMREALDTVAPDPDLRRELDAAFLKIADFLRNTDAGGVTRPHPGRPRETTPGRPAPVHTSSPDGPPLAPIPPISPTTVPRSPR